jgi:hypothetical protein
MFVVICCRLLCTYAHDMAQGPLIPPSRVAADEDDDALPAGGPREALGSADPLPLGADPNWRAASNSSMRYG